MFVAVAGEREVMFSWSPPPVTQQNGVISSYTLSCSPSPSSLPQFPTQSGSLTVIGFSPNTLYSCSLTANNIQGSGPPTSHTFTTQKDSKCLFFSIMSSIVVFFFRCLLSATAKRSIILLRCYSKSQVNLYNIYYY